MVLGVPILKHFRVYQFPEMVVYMHSSFDLSWCMLYAFSHDPVTHRIVYCTFVILHFRKLHLGYSNKCTRNEHFVMSLNAVFQSNCSVK